MTPRRIYIRHAEHVLREHRAYTTRKPQLYYQDGQWQVLVDPIALTNWNYFYALEWVWERNHEAATTTSSTHAPGKRLQTPNRRMADRNSERTGWRAATVRPAADPGVTRGPHDRP